MHEGSGRVTEHPDTYRNPFRGTGDQHATSMTDGIKETIKGMATMKGGIKGDSSRMEKSAKSTRNTIGDNVGNVGSKISGSMPGEGVQSGARRGSKNFLDLYGQEMEDDGITRSEADTIGSNLFSRK